MNYYVYSDFYQFRVFIIAVQGEMLRLDTVMFWNNATVKSFKFSVIIGTSCTIAFTDSEWLFVGESCSTLNTSVTVFFFFLILKIFV